MRLVVENQWNGEKSPRPDVRAEVSFEQVEGGMAVKASMPRREDEKVPDAPARTRVENLWEYDVVELFLVGDDGKYLEIELGPGGHYLILGFDGVRRRSDGHIGLDPHIEMKKDDRSWSSSCLLPPSIVPTPLKAVNAFVIASGLYLAAFPVPGEKPDFHQPGAFPTLTA